MTIWLRYSCFLLVVAGCAVGQFIAREFWPVVFAFSSQYHPNALWVIGGLGVFSLLPALTLFLAVAALVWTSRKKQKIKKTLRGLCMLSVAFLALMAVGTRGESGLILMFLVLPFVIIHIGSVLGFSATLDEPQRG